MTFANMAAEAAGNRAAECRLRLAELTSGRRVAAEDVDRARLALKQAIDRARQAQGRLLDERRRREVRRAWAPVKRSAWPLEPRLEAKRVRDAAAALTIAEMFPAYLALGGHFASLELDGFLNGVIDLPPGELSILAQAVWELTELSGDGAS